MKLAPPYKPPTINRLSRPDVFVLASIDAGTWQILNKRYGPGDARLVVATVREIGADEVWVEWSAPTDARHDLSDRRSRCSTAPFGIAASTRRAVAAGRPGALPAGAPSREQHPLAERSGVTQRSPLSGIRLRS